MLTSFDYDPLLDLPPWQGQRQASYRFDAYNAVTGEILGDLHPIRPAQLAHDTGRTIKRQLTLSLATEETAALDPVTTRVRPYMVFPNGQEFPLGVYMFTSATDAVFSAGPLGSYTLGDEMYIVDQVSTMGISAVTRTGATSSPVAVMVDAVLANVGFPIVRSIEPSPYNSNQSWPLGTNRGGILGDLSITGDYWSPWFDNNGVLRFIRTFDPFDRLPDFDFDSNQTVYQSTIQQSTALLSAPNRFIVISNSAEDDNEVPVYASVDVPVQLPYSVPNRGFVISQVTDAPVLSADQARVIAKNLAARAAVYETVSLSIAPDPRHDSYNVSVWQGENWLELSWSLALQEGAPMTVVMRRAYASV